MLQRINSILPSNPFQSFRKRKTNDVVKLEMSKLDNISRNKSLPPKLRAR